MSIPEVLSLLAFAGSLYLLIPVLLIERRRRERTIPLEGIDRTSESSEAIPKVSIILAARNEENAVRATLHRLRGQDYPAFDVIAVDDRSDDGTGRILDEESAKSDRVSALHVERLPEKWLGKCHALWLGATQADGEWLLFTDADVLFDPDVVRLAVLTATRLNADHLTLFPKLMWKGKLEASLLTLFAMMLGVGFRLWMVESRSMNAWVGVGAFNMIRRDLYDLFNGHEALRLEVADDMKLGYLAKKYGGRSAVAYAGSKLRVRWREGAWDVVRGLVRSAFAGMNFNWGRMLYAVAGIALVFIVPLVLILLPVSTPALLAAIATFAVLTISLGLTARAHRIPLHTVLFYPAAALLFLYALIFSAISTAWKGGVGWRDTFYSIRDLRHGSVR